MFCVSSDPLMFVTQLTSGNVCVTTLPPGEGIVVVVVDAVVEVVEVVVGSGGPTNVAVTFFDLSIGRRHTSPLPAHSPDQPSNTLSSLGTAIRRSSVPAGTSRWQAGPEDFGGVQIVRSSTWISSLEFGESTLRFKVCTSSTPAIHDLIVSDAAGHEVGWTLNFIVAGFTLPAAETHEYQRSVGAGSTAETCAAQAALPTTSAVTTLATEAAKNREPTRRFMTPPNAYGPGVSFSEETIVYSRFYDHVELLQDLKIDIG
jgi:hypothetical protein